jgi:hypothetical protein
MPWHLTVAGDHGSAVPGGSDIGGHGDSPSRGVVSRL